MEITIYFDGGSFRNRVCVYDPLKDKYMVKQIHGDLTNNELEYIALIRAVKYARLQYKYVHLCTFIGDSKLIINQVFSTWRINHAHLVKLNAEALAQLTYMGVQKTTAKWVRRNKNKAGIHLEKLMKQEKARKI